MICANAVGFWRLDLRLIKNLGRTEKQNRWRLVIETSTNSLKFEDMKNLQIRYNYDLNATQNLVYFLNLIEVQLP